MKAKKLLAGVMALAMAVTSMTDVMAYDLGAISAESGETGTYNGFSYEVLEDGTVAITSYNNVGTLYLNIPSEINGKKVTVIGKAAFRGDDCAIEITVPDTVTTIGANAFYGCVNCTKITLPDSVTSIGENAFQKCVSLTELDIPDNVTSIEKNTFSECKALTKIDLPDRLTYIGETAFNECESLIEIDIPEGVTTLEYGTFFNCTALTKVTLPEGVTSLKYYAFYRCLSLSSVNLPDSLTDIGMCALYGCAFTNIKIPQGVTSIDDGAFMLCTNLTEVELPDGLTYMGNSVFLYCSDDLTIYGHTGSYAETYANENGITFVSVDDNDEEKDPGYVGENVDFTYEVLEDGTVSVTEYNGSDEKVVIPDEIAGKAVTSIGGFAFAGNKTVIEITIPDTVTSVGASAFRNCTALVKIRLPDSVTYIGGYAFFGCTALVDLKLPKSVDYMGSGVFSQCFELPSVELPSGVTAIVYGDFNACTSLAEITIPQTVETIATYYDPFKDSPLTTIYGYTGSAAESYAKEYEITFIPIGYSATDDKTGVEVQFGEGVAPDTAELVVKDKSDESDDSSRVYDITLTYNGEEIQPNGEVVVKIPIPEEWDTADVKIYVYHRDENGELTEIEAKAYGGYIVFTAAHFSEYIISTKRLTVLMGDVNGSGKIDDIDVVALARYVAGWNVTIDLAAADVNGDAKVNDADVVMLARRVAGWKV